MMAVPVSIETGKLEHLNVAFNHGAQKKPASSNEHFGFPYRETRLWHPLLNLYGCVDINSAFNSTSCPQDESCPASYAVGHQDVNQFFYSMAKLPFKEHLS